MLERVTESMPPERFMLTWSCVALLCCQSVRLNASHGTHEYFQSVIDNARAVVEQTPGRPLAIALDTVSWKPHLE